MSHYALFFFNDTATTEIYTLSLHDALPISQVVERDGEALDGGAHESVSNPAGNELERAGQTVRLVGRIAGEQLIPTRSEEHTSELQSQSNLVCRLLLEKKKKQKAHRA